ncbi:unnamed protein product [Coccothraustes coccothraustes]
MLLPGLSLGRRSPGGRWNGEKLLSGEAIGGAAALGRRAVPGPGPAGGRRGHSKLTLDWDLPPAWTLSPLKTRSTLAPAVPACRIQQLYSPGQPGAAAAELVM